MTAKGGAKLSQNYVKIVITKHIIEFMEYEKLNIQKNPKFDYDEIEKGTGIYKEENYQKYQKVRSDMIRRLITMNFDNTAKFVTLTFRKLTKDVKEANLEFHKFMKRLKRKYPNLRYVAVIEFQDKYGRGAVHYHMIVNLPYIKAKELETIWAQGFVKINAIDKVDNLGAYVIKYMTKDQADERLQGLKAYNCSKGLERPLELKSWNGETELIKQIFDKYGLKEKKPVYSSKYTSDNAGDIVYVQYNLKRES